MKNLYLISFRTISNYFCNFLILPKQLQVNFCENGTGGDLDEKGTFMEKTGNCEEFEREEEKEEKEAGGGSEAILISGSPTMAVPHQEEERS